jgi:hypothetical protein
MDRVDGLKLVLQNDGYTQAEKDAARASLEDIYANAITGHEREAARHVLATLAAENSGDELPSDDLLRLMYFTNDVNLAREMWREQVKKSNQ